MGVKLGTDSAVDPFFSDLILDELMTILKSEFVLHKMPVVDLIQIQTNDPFKVLIATILSARTKDSVTAIAAKRFFEIVPDLISLQKMSSVDISKIIYPVGFYKTKACYLANLPNVIFEKFSGNIPSTVDDLVKLPGVGRKTANLVVAIAFDKPAICVDVHVHRICNRLGYLKTKKPFDTEMVLRHNLPIKHWKIINSVLVSYGQHLCYPINPRCDICVISKYCKRIGVNSKFVI